MRQAVVDTPAGGALNLRISPSAQAARVSAQPQLPVGTRVRLLRAKGDWVQVQVREGVRGWVRFNEAGRSYLSVPIPTVGQVLGAADTRQHANAATPGTAIPGTTAGLGSASNLGSHGELLPDRGQSPAGHWTSSLLGLDGILLAKDGTFTVRSRNVPTTGRWSESGGLIRFSGFAGKWGFPTERARWGIERGELVLEFLYPDGLSYQNNTFTNPYRFQPWVGGAPSSQARPRSELQAAWVHTHSTGVTGIAFLADGTVSLRGRRDHVTARWEESGGVIRFSEGEDRWPFPTFRCRWAVSGNEIRLLFIHDDGLPYYDLSAPRTYSFWRSGPAGVPGG